MPSFIYQHHYRIESEKVLGWREKPEKVVSGEAKIKDVCANCNNIILSAYDSHAKDVLEGVNIFQKNYLAKEALLQYDYQLLSKWLLKVAYNSSRASDKQVGEFEKFKDYIVCKSDTCPDYFIACGILKPVKLSKEETENYGEAFGIEKPGYINPFFTRISWIPNSPKEYTVKQIVIGALVFHVCIFIGEIERQERKRIKKQYTELCKNMQIISPNKKKLKILQLPISFIDSMSPHMMRDSVRPEMEKLLTKTSIGPK